MKHLFYFKKHKMPLNESYEFIEIDSNVKQIEYNFTNRDNLTFKVIFKPKYWKRDDIWVREYDLKTKIDNKSFAEINIHDTFNIINTLTAITNDYLIKYQPAVLEIEHIETDDEMKQRMKRGSKLSIDGKINDQVTNKRALINKRSLEKNLTPLYDYKLIGYVSVITKKGPA